MNTDAGLTVNIAEIRVERRHRQELRNIEELAASIERVGLLHPVVVTEDKRLISGLRRLKAYQQLGRDRIPVRVIHNMSEAVDLLIAERDENTCREDFLPSEAVAMGRSIEEVERPRAEQRQREGATRAGKASAAKRRPGNAGQSFPHVRRDESTRTAAKAGVAVGMSRPTYERARAVVESGKKDLIAEMDRTGRVNGVWKKLQRDKAADELAKEPPPLPEGPFRVLVVDPPWRYSKRPDDPSHRGSLGYPSMTLDDIKAMPVETLAHEDSVLWLWTTNAHMEHAFGIARAWGFDPKTILTWGKNKMGTGDWLRGKTEHCLLCVRGKPIIKLTNQTTLLVAPTERHSEKPKEFFRLVEDLCPGSKCELFARKTRRGWTSWGNEVPGAVESEEADK